VDNIISSFIQSESLDELELSLSATFLPVATLDAKSPSAYLLAP